MEDKKQIEEMAIEEMARLFIKASCKGSECEKCLFIDSVKEAEACCVCLKAFYKAGYRKLPQNAVVLTGSETEEHLVDLLVDFDEMSFTPDTLVPNPEEYAIEWKRKLIYAIGQVRKEVAQEFFDLSEEWGGGVMFYQKARKLAKEYGVE